MQTDFVAVPPFWTVGHVIDHMREADDLPETFSDIFVVDPDLSRARRGRSVAAAAHQARTCTIESIMDATGTLVLATADQEEVARQFERYDLKSAPVVDANQRLVGVVTVDDVVEVIEEEADEDIRRLAGVGDESIADSVRQIAPAASRGCSSTSCTAILASSVIKLFDATIEQMVALAVLMPIVASMGGNAGTQTMTVAVRALATGDLGAGQRVARHPARDRWSGSSTASPSRRIMGVVVFLWFGIGHARRGDRRARW